MCHLAFWDERVLFILNEWKKTGIVQALKFDVQAVDSINQGINFLALEVPVHAAAKLVLESAATVDAVVAEIKPELTEKIKAAGFERFLQRSLHRRQHLQKILDTIEANRAQK